MTFRDSSTISYAVSRVLQAIDSRHNILIRAAKLLNDSATCVSDAQAVGIEQSANNSEYDSEESFLNACQDLAVSVARVKELQKKQWETSVRVDNCRIAQQKFESDIAALDKELWWFFSKILDGLKGAPQRKKLEHAKAGREQQKELESEASDRLKRYQSEEVHEKKSVLKNLEL